MVLPLNSYAATASPTLAERLSGRILLQVESYGRAWYVYPKTNERYYLRNGEEALHIMRTLGLGITNADLAKIPTAKGQTGVTALVERLKGTILLQVEEHGEAWYVNPTDGLRYYLPDGQSAYDLMRRFALGIKDTDLRKVSMNQSQVAADTAFGDVAAARYQTDSQTYDYDQSATVVLPLASLTKLMTTLVVTETNPDWNRVVTITPEEIAYPKSYVGDDPTSEVGFRAGDQVSLGDLLTAALIASSNQAAIILADSTGWSRAEFLERMNAKARELGLGRTRFADPTGLDAENVSTAREFAVIAAAAFAVPRIASTTVQSTEVITATLNNAPRTISIPNRNYSVLAFHPDGVKTGYLVEAQRNVAVKKGNAIVVILHALSMSQRNTLLTKLLPSS